jgi:hypothetical protein
VYVTRIKEKKIAFKILMKKPVGKEPLGRWKQQRENNDK